MPEAKESPPTAAQSEPALGPSLARDASYFVALVTAGSTALLLLLSPVVSIASVLAAAALGVAPESPAVKIGSYGVVTLAWTILVVRYWIRRKALSPRIARAGCGLRLARGHALVAAGHVLVLCILLVPAFAFLMILPVLGVLLCYGAGIILVETARGRNEAGHPS